MSGEEIMAELRRQLAEDDALEARARELLLDPYEGVSAA